MIVHVIHTHSSKVYNDVRWIEVNAVTGNFIILPGHAPLVTTLVSDKPLILMQKNEHAELIHLQRAAFLELFRDTVTVIM